MGVPVLVIKDTAVKMIKILSEEGFIWEEKNKEQRLISGWIYTSSLEQAKEKDVCRRFENAVAGTERNMLLNQVGRLYGASAIDIVKCEPIRTGIG